MKYTLSLKQTNARSIVDLHINEFQNLIEEIYSEKDERRGWELCFIWLVEEIGELGRAMRKDSVELMEEEFADVLAWILTLAYMKGIDIEAAAIKAYGKGCPKCKEKPCSCSGRSIE